MNEDKTPTLVSWDTQSHRFAKWNERVYCPSCGHYGQWELTYSYDSKEEKDHWRPHNRYCPNCLGLYDLPKAYTRRGDPWPGDADGGDALDNVLHERRSNELAALENTLLDGGATLPE